MRNTIPPILPGPPAEGQSPQPVETLLIGQLPPLPRVAFRLAYITAILCESVEAMLLNREELGVDGIDSKELLIGWAWNYLTLVDHYEEDEEYDCVHQFGRLQFALWAKEPEFFQSPLLMDWHPAFQPFKQPFQMLLIELSAAALQPGDLYKAPDGRLIYVVDTRPDGMLLTLDQTGRVNRERLDDTDPARCVKTHLTVGPSSRTPELVEIMYQNSLFTGVFQLETLPRL